MVIGVAKQGGRVGEAPGDKGVVPGKEPFVLLRSLDLILRVMDTHGSVAHKDLSSLDWHLRKLTLAAEQRMNWKGKTRSWEPSEEVAIIQGRIGEVSMKMEGRRRSRAIIEGRNC